MIDNINLSRFPLGRVATVYSGDANSLLELCGEVGEKVNECISVVNGVDTLASQAQNVVQEMQILQSEFVTNANDIRTQMVSSQDTLQADITTEIDDFTELSTVALNNAKSSIELSSTNFKDTATTELNAFIADINIEKNDFIASADLVITNAQTQITTNVNQKIDDMTTDGTLSNIINVELLGGINNTVAKNQVVVSEDVPVNAELWCEIKSETTFEITNDMIFVEI